MHWDITPYKFISVEWEDEPYWYIFRAPRFYMLSLGRLLITLNWGKKRTATNKQIRETE